jgi:23S rRNA (uracil1939-C5)-methyltransferase
MCTIHPKCGACLYSTATYNNIWKTKINTAIKNLKPFVSNNVPIIMHPKDVLRYRKKILLHVKSAIIPPKIGLIQKSDIVNIDLCPLQPEAINKKIDIIKYSLPQYDKFPLQYISFNNETVILVLKDHHSHLARYLDTTKAIFSNVDFPYLYLHLNPSTGNKIFLKSYIYPVYGDLFLKDADGYWYHPLVFQQQIHSLHIESLQIAIDFLKGIDNFLDLYCGIGIASSIAIKYFKNIYGIEHLAISIECAKKNANKARFFVGQVDNRMRTLVKKEPDFFENYVMYTNPPRSGMGKQCIKEILKSPPSKIAYLSCNTKSLKNDLMLFNENYNINAIHFFDFFPYTNHIETLVLMSKECR